MNTPNTTWQERFDEITMLRFDGEHRNENLLKLKTWVAQELQQARKETEKAFGGCTNCYGKGYSTQKVGDQVIHADFVGDKEYRIKGKIEINYCNCNRGRDLFKVIHSLITPTN